MYQKRIIGSIQSSFEPIQSVYFNPMTATIVDDGVS